MKLLNSNQREWLRILYEYLHSINEVLWELGAALFMGICCLLMFAVFAVGVFAVAGSFFTWLAT